MTIHAVLLLCISINGIVRIKNGQKRVLIAGFFMKLLVTWMGLGLSISLFPIIMEKVKVCSCRNDGNEERK